VSISTYFSTSEIFLLLLGHCLRVANFRELRKGEVRTMRLLGSWTKLLRRYGTRQNPGTSLRRSMPEDLPTPPALPCNHF
jgi:hypothetical protein